MRADSTTNTVYVETFADARGLADYIGHCELDPVVDIGFAAAAKCDATIYWDPKSIVVEFCEPVLKQYFDRVYDMRDRHEFATINMETGEEQVFNDGTVSRDSVQDPRLNSYLRVLRYIIRRGFNNFEFTFYDSTELASEVCCVTYGSTPPVRFEFERVVDPILFVCLENYVNQNRQAAKFAAVCEAADKFIRDGGSMDDL